MSSGLGTTIQAAGEPGSVMGNVPPQAETAPDQPGQIVQTTAIQTLDQLLHGNWIYDSTFTVSTVMPAGTIVYVKPIHPQEWNWPNRIVSRMFNSWTGSGKIRYRPLATAWYGGSIRVGFLPPNIREDELRSLPLEVLTSYPNRDIDPKNTGWVDFRGPDQREIAYHYMNPFDGTDRQNFGGYIVFYVAGKLVTQAPEFTTIQFIVETAGDFMYDQPGPRALEDTQAAPNPLGSLISLPITHQPLVDSMDSGYTNFIQVLPSSVNTLLAGGNTMSSVGLPYSIGKIPSLQVTDEHMRPWIGDKPIASAYVFTVLNTQSGFCSISANPQVPPYNGVPLQSFTSAAQCTNTAGNIPDTMKWQSQGITYPIYREATTTFTMEPSLGRVRDFTPGVSASIPEYISWAPDGTTVPQALDVSAARSGISIRPMASGESIVVFANMMYFRFAVQTVNQRFSMNEWPNDMTATNQSWLYNIVNEGGTPIALIRLNPNGVFTTNAVTTSTIFPGTCRLRYFGTLALDTPLPPMTTLARQYRVSAHRVLAEKLPLHEFTERLSSEANIY